MSINFNFKIDESVPDGIVQIVNTSSLSDDARDHPCLLDGKEHDFSIDVGNYKKCSKCGMSYESPQSSGVFYF